MWNRAIRRASRTDPKEARVAKTGALTIDPLAAGFAPDPAAPGENVPGAAVV